jgi:hypothetical protein
MKSFKIILNFIAVFSLLLFGANHTSNQQIESPFVKEKQYLSPFDQREPVQDEETSDSVLRNGIEVLQSNYDSTSDIDQKTKIKSLIRTATNLLSNTNPQVMGLSSNYNVDNNPVLKAIAAFFITANMPLSEEFFLHSLDVETVENELYYPVYGSRITGSPVIEDIANNTALNGTGIFQKDNQSVLKNDLAYSIQNFSWSKQNANSKVVTITDTYDFKPEDEKKYNDIVAYGVNACINAHSAGTLKYYRIQITADMENILYPTLKSISKNEVNIEIANRSNNQITIFYNATTVSETDALWWQNLSKVKYVKLDSNSSIELKIARNDKDFCIFSKIGGTHYHFSTIVRLYANDIDFHYHESAQAYAGNQLLNLGKCDNSWVMMFKNTSNEKKEIQYNAKMCTEDDAKNWFNLVDVKSDEIEKKESYVFMVQENGFSTHIALRILDSSNEVRFWINNLDMLTNLSIGTSKIERFFYLKLSIISKSGNQWCINVKNETSSPIYFVYNKKMCFKSDALNWTNLNDISKEILLDSNQSTSITIFENWFADSIAVSYINNNNKRLISCDYKLSSGNNSMAMENNII